MKTKYLELTMADERVYLVPMHVIADNRAKHYAENDPDTTYEEEYNAIMGDKITGPDNGMGSDWYFNNMNPEDVEDHVILHYDAPRVEFRDAEVVDSRVRTIHATDSKKEKSK